MHDAHKRTAEQQELMEQAHHTGAELNEQSNNKTGNWHSERTLDYSDQVYRLAKEAHAKSGQIRTL